MNEKELIIQQHEENAWLVINADTGEIEDIITKDNVVEYCKLTYEYCDDNMEYFIDNVWGEIGKNHTQGLLNHYCEEFDKFCAWLNFVCVEYFANEMVTSYKQRLLDFE